MSKLELVDDLFGDVRYMSRAQAETIRDIITTEGARDILEIQGKFCAADGLPLSVPGRVRLFSFRAQANATDKIVLCL